MRCKAFKPDRRRCNAQGRKDSGLCTFHDPAYKEMLPIWGKIGRSRRYTCSSDDLCTALFGPARASLSNVTKEES